MNDVCLVFTHTHPRRLHFSLTKINILLFIPRWVWFGYVYGSNFSEPLLFKIPESSPGLYTLMTVCYLPKLQPLVPSLVL